MKLTISAVASVQAYLLVSPRLRFQGTPMPSALRSGAESFLA